jgi:hypothetical protein
LKGFLDAAEAVTDSKEVIYDGFRQALGQAVPVASAGIVVDEEIGAGILRDASRNGYVTVLSTERSGASRRPERSRLHRSWAECRTRSRAALAGECRVRPWVHRFRDWTVYVLATSGGLRRETGDAPGSGLAHRSALPRMGDDLRADTSLPHRCGVIQGDPIHNIDVT